MGSAAGTHFLTHEGAQWGIMEPGLIVPEKTKHICILTACEKRHVWVPVPVGSAARLRALREQLPFRTTLSEPIASVFPVTGSGLVLPTV